MKGLLQDNNIPCFLKDEHINTINPLYSQAFGGIRLMIREEDLDRAASLLAETGNQYQNQIRCSNCGSFDVHFVTNTADRKNWFWILFSLITLSYPLYLEKKYACRKCQTVSGLEK